VAKISIDLPDDDKYAMDDEPVVRTAPQPAPPAPAPKREPVKPIAKAEPKAAPAPKREPVKPIAKAEPKAAPAPKREPVKPIAKAEPKAAPAPKREPVKPIAKTEPKAAPAPKREPVKPIAKTEPKAATAPKSEPVKPIAKAEPKVATAPKSEPVKPIVKTEQKESLFKRILSVFKNDKSAEVKLAEGGTRIKFRILRLSIISVVASVIIMQAYSVIGTISSYNTIYTNEANALVDAYSVIVSEHSDDAALSQSLSAIAGENNIYVLDKNGTVIVSDDTSLVQNAVSLKGNNDEGLARLADEMMSQKSGTTRYTSNGTVYLAAYKPLSGTDNTIAVGLNYSSVISNIISNVVISTALALFVIVVTTFIGIGIANKITRPIARTAGRNKKLSEGDVSSEFSTNSPNDETRVLTNSLHATVSELNKYITDIKHVLSEIADGNLAASSAVQYKGDFEELGASLTVITDSLNRSFVSVKDSLETFKQGAMRVAEDSKQLSAASASEAAAVADVITSIGSISEKADSTAQISAKVLGVTNEANTNAQRGAAMMRELSDAIENIRDKSDAISAVIKTIDSIAFQTNILALNASIEAARAGEAGRGFSVVAQEVGSLASMSADAVKQTAVLINDTITAVKQGTEIAERAERAISTIADDVNEVAGYMDSIVTAANEQNAAVEQITSGMQRIDDGMRVTTSTAEQSAVSGEELSRLAVSLSDEVSRFKTK